MIQAFERRYHFSVSSECFSSCDLCETLGCLCPETPSNEEILRSLDEAKMLDYTCVVFPPNTLLNKSSIAIVQAALERGLQTIVRVRTHQFKGKHRSTLRRLLAIGNECQSDIPADRGSTRRGGTPSANTVDSGGNIGIQSAPQLQLKFELVIDGPIIDSELEAVLTVLPALPNLSIALVPTRRHDLTVLMDSLPSSIRQRMSILAPLKSERARHLPSADELNEWLETARRERPAWNIPPYPEMDRHPSARLEKWNQDHASFEIFRRIHDETDIRVSVIVCFNRDLGEVLPCLEHLAQQTIVPIRYEVIGVIDSVDEITHSFIKKWAETEAPHINIRLVALKKSEAKNERYFSSMSQARNAGAFASHGERLVFLSPFALVPNDFLEDVVTAHSTADVIQYRRLTLPKEKAEETIRLPEWASRETFADAIPDRFFERLHDGTPWNARADGWKFLSSFCFSIPTQLFFESGGFPRAVLGEDVSTHFFGWKLNALRVRWSARFFNIYCKADQSSHSEMRQRRRKISNDLEAFYFSTLDPSVYRIFFEQLGTYPIPRKALRELAAFPVTRPLLAGIRFIIFWLLDHWPSRQRIQS
jgi:hypothetical protein